MSDDENGVRTKSAGGSTAKRHHYVPEFYLKGFAVPRKKEHQTTVIDRSGRTFATAIKNVAAETGFNAIDGPQPDVVENAFASIEAEFAPALARIAAAKSLANDQDREILMYFIAWLAIRNPRFRETFRQFQANVSKQIVDLSLASRERWEGQVKQMEAAGVRKGPAVDYEVVKEFHESGKYKIEVPVERHLEIAAPAVDAVFPHLMRRGWTLMSPSSAAGEFISSDHPVCLTWSDPARQAGFYGPGFGLEGTTVVVPLRHDLAAIGTFGGREVFLDGLKEINAARVNRTVAAYALRQVYARGYGFVYATGEGGTTLRKGSRLVGDSDFRRTNDEGHE
ncbi:MAG: DUF4238 domain-containing protein [Bauldia sp.]|nr:DUF4238 domain-containing protein [Bauldia sp.]MCW5717144.1 DUF4238 domain-containing protein [Bauldia sp.]